MMKGIMGMVAVLMCMMAMSASGVHGECWKFADIGTVVIGHCPSQGTLEMCFTVAHGVEWRVWLRGPGGRVGYSGYQQSKEGAIKHAVEDYVKKYPDCLTTTATAHNATTAVNVDVDVVVDEATSALLASLNSILISMKMSSAPLISSSSGDDGAEAGAGTSTIPNGCKDFADLAIVNIGHCASRGTLELCATITRVEWRVWLRGPDGRIGYSGYQQSREGAVRHAVEDYARKYPECLTTTITDEGGQA